MAVKTLLHYAEKELRKLKKHSDNSNKTRFNLVLVFDRTEAEMKKLCGYAQFAEELAKLGNEHTEDAIFSACEVSHFNRESVHFDDMEEETENFTIPIECTKEQARRAMYHNRDFNNLQILL